MNGRKFIIAVQRSGSRSATTFEPLVELLRWDIMHMAEGMAIMAEPGLRVAVADGTDTAWLIGTVFDRHGPGVPIDRIAPTLAFDIAGEGRTLLDRYWGAYLAIGKEAGEYSFLRDPSGAIPCYYLLTEDFVVLTNSVPALVRIGLLSPRLSWDGVARALYGSGLPSRGTAIERVEELLPGNRLRVERQCISTRELWSPWHHVEFDRRAEIKVHAERVRRVVDSTVGAWAGRFTNVLTTVSGGLDSSIVLSSCSRSAARISSVTMSTHDRNGDERRFARLVCDHVSSPLTEAWYDIADMDMATSASRQLPRPIGRSPALAYDRAVGRVADALGVEAVFTGNGGDNVFAFSQSAAAIADRARHEGLKALWPTVKDVCMLTGCNVVEALGAARRLSIAGGAYRWKVNGYLLDADLLAALDDRLTHPWLDAPPDAVPGKAAHIAGLLRIQQHLDGTHRFANKVVVNPLMSQPVVETCLAVPTWMWCCGGRDRAVARMAFRDALPVSIVKRTSKGGPDGFGMMFLSRFRSEIADRLLGGELARHRLIDRSAVERLLFSERPDAGAGQVRLLELIDTEAWIGHWQDVGRQVDAARKPVQ